MFGASLIASSAVSRHAQEFIDSTARDEDKSSGRKRLLWGE